MERLNNKNRKTVAAIFHTPTLTTIRYGDVERLLKALGFNLRQGNGSRVRFERSGLLPILLHKPHPSSTIKKYVVHDLRARLTEIGIQP